MLRFVIDQVMQNPAQVVFRRLVGPLEVDDALEIFVVV